MLLWLRKSLFYLLAVLYLVLTPYIIFYALGYTYNPAERELRKTGLISISTYPRRATVYIEGQKFSLRTPAAIRELLPGDYTLRISSKGFDTWEKRVHVDSEKALRLDPVLLLPRKAEDEILSSQPYRDLIPEIVDSKIYTWAGKTADTLWKTDLFFRNESPADPASVTPADVRVLNTFSKKSSPVVIFETEQNNEKGYAALDLTQGKKLVRLPADAKHFDWDSKNPSQIYFMQKGKLVGMDLRKKKMEEIAEGIRGFGVKHQRLYLLSPDLSLIKTDRKGKNAEVLFEDSLILKSRFMSREPRFCRIEVLKRDFFQRDLLLFLTDAGALWSNWPPYELAGGEVLGFEYASHLDEEKIVFWTHHKIGIGNFGEEEIASERKAKSEVRWIFDGGVDIHQAFWAYDDTHIIFLDGDQIYLLEAQGPEPYFLRPLASVLPGTSIIYNDRSHQLYFLNPAGQLVKRKVGE